LTVWVNLLVEMVGVEVEEEDREKEVEVASWEMKRIDHEPFQL